MSKEKTIINVEGMSCSHCEHAVTEAVKELDGVIKVKVSLKKKTAEVEYDSEKVALDKIKAAIVEAGYKVV